MIGTPVRHAGRLYNCAVAARGGKILGIVPKSYMARKAFKGVYDDETLSKWLNNFMHRFFHQQFKRSYLPDGPKVGSVSLSPRGDWRMPSDLE